MIDNWKIELIAFPVTDIDRAKAFYVDQLGFVCDHDATPNDDIRFVQLTPPGSACSIAIGKGVSTMEPGSLNAVQIVVPSAADAYTHLRENGVECSEVVDEGWGLFVYFSDPDGNKWALQELPDYATQS
ncbi:VOC family protein [Herbiconiux sp. KACC 21604]|uniref:VOC family protein n=1 Tax=unclassified Herbiconiux TaxID=2618217 RepID=UPI001491C6BB|nr:VOC family protein [Herbiconiux sp. SALV-R1]QJU54477.1 glyoxalase [Herbiconiux sp. SALV-R1]WPO85555.1 VOC family protein [Herbiconiux sp. KACC 21604]